MVIDGHMADYCRTIWAALRDASRNELRHGFDFQMDGKRSDETNKREPFTDRTNNYQTHRQFKDGKNGQQIIFREGCYYA